MSISSKTKKLLLARSGGYCQNPECNADLYPYFESGKITNVEELAHIIGQKQDGPRGNSTLALSDRDEYNNIILLCPTCHTKIDKNPDIYGVETLHNWKIDHEEKIKSSFHSPTYQNRAELRKVIQKLSVENKIIFNRYGPQSNFALKTTQSEASKMWEMKAIETLIPNNRKIYELLNRNYLLLNEKELETFANFKIHKEGFEYNKLSGDKNSSVPLFPSKMNDILK